MKLQKQKSYTRAGVDYHKFVVTLPPEHIETLGWKHGTELEAILKKEGLLLRPMSD